MYLAVQFLFSYILLLNIHVRLYLQFLNESIYKIKFQREACPRENRCARNSKRRKTPNTRGHLFRAPSRSSPPNLKPLTHFCLVYIVPPAQKSKNLFPQNTNSRTKSINVWSVDCGVCTYV